MVADRAVPRRLAHLQHRQPPSREGVVTPMTYTGQVSPGGPPDSREAGELVITKVAVDAEMSNNCYLLRCTATGDQVLVDAAAEPETLLPLIGDAGLTTSSPPTSTGTTTARSPTWSPPRGRRSWPALPTPTRSPSRPVSP